MALEILAVVTGVGSVWLLSRNQPLGWWIGLVSVSAFAFVFARARLYGDVGIQVFYFVTSLQAIWVWIRGGEGGAQRPVMHLPRSLALATVPAVIAGTLVLRIALAEMGGAAPFWDALATVGSITAHLYLVWRYVESWYLWVAVDLVYVPLFLSRGLELTALLYVGFLLLSLRGLARFRVEARAPLPVPSEASS